jgi:LacI family transcriptional regulator
VLVDGYAPGRPFDSVITDNFTGAYEAVRYLIEQGHRHIGLIGSTGERADNFPSIAERREGYLRALKDAGIQETYIVPSTLERWSGQEALSTLLEHAPQVTAVFCCNDEVAMGALDTARKHGVDVPRQLSIIGFDNIDTTPQLTPALTTVHVDKVTMGVMAVRLLKERIEKVSRPTITLLLGTHVVVRETVSPPRTV